MCVSDCAWFSFKGSIWLLPEEEPEEEPGEPAPDLMDEEDELNPTPLAALLPSPSLVDTSAEGSDGSDENMDGSEVDIEEEVEEEEDEHQEEDEQQEQEQQQVRKKGAPLPVALVARAAEQPFQRGRVDC